MVRFRKLVMAVAAASALTSGMANALELGPVLVMSAQHQPLHAEIELRDLQGLTQEELIPKLASSNVFAQAGVDRKAILYSLKFAPVVTPGRSVIRITSSQPVNTSELNFLMELLWPNGRLIRELNVSLGSSVAGSEAVSVLHLPTAKQEVAASGSRTRPRTAAQPAASANAEELGPEYRVQANDRLWDIAMRARAGGTVHQAMLAIQELNPDAFIDNNINRLKVGSVLRMPNGEQVLSRNQADAMSQVQQQMVAWRDPDGQAAQQLDATRRTAAGQAPTQVAAGDSLRLVASGGDAAGGSEAGSPDGKSLEDQLAVAQESLDSSRRENEELRDRVADLESQLDKLQRLIELKDSRLAAMQADLSREGEALPEGAAPSAEELALASAGEDSAAEPVAEGAVDQPSAAEEATQDAAAEQPSADAAAEETSQDESAKPGLIQAIMAHSLFWWVIGGLALLIMLLALYLSRRDNEDDEYDDDEEDDEEPIDPGATAAIGGSAAATAAPVVAAGATEEEADEDELDFDLDLSEDDLELDDFELPEVDDAALELAKASIESGDINSAREILQQILIEGNESQRQEAQALLNKLV